MSYRAYHDDDDRDVINCVTLSDTRPVARNARSTPAAAVRRLSQWGCATRRRFMLVDGEQWHEKSCLDCEYYQP
jgi:hypothetical protein